MRVQEEGKRGQLVKRDRLWGRQVGCWLEKPQTPAPVAWHRPIPLLEGSTKPGQPLPVYTCKGRDPERGNDLTKTSKQDGGQDGIRN